MFLIKSQLSDMIYTMSQLGKKVSKYSKYSEYRAKLYASRPLEWKMMVKSRIYERQYGITFQDVINQWESQDKKCAICGLELISGLGNRGKRNVINVDHDHITGKFRGVLCQKCNTGLGGFNDCIENLERAIIYLKK